MEIIDVVKMALLLVGVQGLSIPSAVRLVPCAPPRFDAFDERIVGTWWDHSPSTPSSQTDDDDDDDAQEPKASSSFVVEEVMRSCGGAVQGIREIAWNKRFDNEAGPYLNRADDGFLFQDDGSYTWGPTTSPPRQDNDDTSAAASFVSSFFLERNIRVLLLPAKNDVDESPGPMEPLVVLCSYVVVSRMIE